MSSQAASDVGFVVLDGDLSRNGHSLGKLGGLIIRMQIVGDAGVLCQPNDFISLYEVLKNLVQNAGKRKELAEAGRQRALERFTLDAYARGLDDVYRAFLS